MPKTRAGKTASEQKFAKIIGHNVARIRFNRGLIQQQVADQAGLSKSALARIEKGETLPNHDVMQVLAEALGVTVEMLQADASAVEGLSPSEQKLLEWFRSLPQEKQVTAIVLLPVLTM